jgi:nitrous oxidase accessory protein NosD
VGRWKAGRLWCATVGLCLLSLAIGSLGPARAAAVLLVDDNVIGAQCPTAAYHTISDAIAAANEGDTIVVCPGSYGPTTVDKRVTLSGYTRDLSTVKKCSDPVNNPADQPTKDSIVEGFTVTADFVTIRGFTLTGAADGVLLPAGSDAAWITRNVFQDNAIGVNLNGEGSLVQRNCLRDNNHPGSAMGTGIYSDQGLQSAIVDGNVFFDNHEVAIVLLDTAGLGELDNVHVKNNVSIDDGDLISIAGSTNSEIKDNRSTGSIGSGIFVEAGAFGPNSTLSILNNSLRDGGDEGIFVDANALTNSTVKKNSTKGNASFGIHVATGNTGNLFANNNFTNGGAALDCFDESAAFNTWKSNKGKTASPPSICKKK